MHIRKDHVQPTPHKPQGKVVKKRRRTTDHVSCDRMQDEFGKGDMEANGKDIDVKRICGNQSSVNQRNNEVEQRSGREVQSSEREVGVVNS